MPEKTYSTTVLPCFKQQSLKKDHFWGEGAVKKLERQGKSEAGKKRQEQS